MDSRWRGFQFYPGLSDALSEVSGLGCQMIDFDASFIDTSRWLDPVIRLIGDGW
jgi:hypothetical protein